MNASDTIKYRQPVPYGVSVARRIEEAQAAMNIERAAISRQMMAGKTMLDEYLAGFENCKPGDIIYASPQAPEVARNRKLLLVA